MQISHSRKLSAMLGALLLAFGLVTLAGCAKGGDVPEATEQAEQEALAPDGQPEGDPMADRTITDDAGREVTIPGVGALERIYYTGGPAQIFCFTLAPELAGGTTMEFSDAELQYLPKGTDKLEYLGTVSGGKELNPEAIMAAGIQVIFSVTLGEPGDSDASSADDLQRQTGIPVVVLNGSLDATAQTYRTLGGLLGKEAEAEELASYCEDTLDNVRNAVAAIPEDQRVKLYYAEGSEGLQTEPKGSNHSLCFDVAGADNVATGIEAVKGKGMSPVSLEQVLAWNPQVIIAWDDVVRGGADELIRTDPNWANIDAVQNGRVYTMPNVPFSWCDRPPAVNRILGIQWVANLLYPQEYDVDMVAVTKDFYSKFYHADITDDQAKEILGSSYTA